MTTGVATGPVEEPELKFLSSRSELTASFLQTHAGDWVPSQSLAQAQHAPVGWDFYVVDVESHILRFPKDREALEALEREERVCALLPSMRLQTPKLKIVYGEYPFSIHEKIPGDHLLTNVYESLHEAERMDVADRLAEFFQLFHQTSPSQAQSLGARFAPSYLDVESMRALAADVLPEEWRENFESVMANWETLVVPSADQIFGYFDAHGWNMAFDLKRNVLQGIFDFSDCGIGDVHMEFHPLNVISPDLKARVVHRYAEATGRVIDHNRVDLYTYVAEYSDLFERYLDADGAEGVDHHLGMLHYWVETLGDP